MIHSRIERRKTVLPRPIKFGHYKRIPREKCCLKTSKIIEIKEEHKHQRCNPKPNIIFMYHQIFNFVFLIWIFKLIFYFKPISLKYILWYLF